MGVDIVNHELLLVCGAIAWAFHITKKIGDDGEEIEVKDLEYSSLLIAKPDNFAFDLISRNEKKRQKVVEMWKVLEPTEEGLTEQMSERSFDTFKV